MILLVGLEGISYEETAEILAIPVGTVRSRLSLGRDILRRLLDMEERRSTAAPNGHFTRLARYPTFRARTHLASVCSSGRAASALTKEVLPWNWEHAEEMAAHESPHICTHVSRVLLFWGSLHPHAPAPPEPH